MNDFENNNGPIQQNTKQVVCDAGSEQIFKILMATMLNLVIYRISRQIAQELDV